MDDHDIEGICESMKELDTPEKKDEINCNETERYAQIEKIEDEDYSDYMFLDINEGEEYEVPIKFSDEKESKSAYEIETSKRNKSTAHQQKELDFLGRQGQLKKSVSMCSLSNSGHIRSGKRRSSLKKNLSYSSLSSLGGSLDDETEGPKMKRNVSFTSLDVREYSITLGDNPSVRKGPPISLSWNYSEGGSIDIEKWEEVRGPRRSKEQMLMGSIIRRSILENNAGISRKDILEATSEVLRIKKNRNNSISRKHFSRLEETLESAKRKMKRAIPKVMR